MNLKRVWALLAAVLLTFALVACGDSDKKGDDGDKGNGGNADAAVINAVEYGVDNTGKTDMTDKMIAMHKEAAKQGKPVYYPNGTYLFNGATLDFSSGVEFESMDGVTVRNSIADTNIINFDDAGNLIGLMHNHLEQQYDWENPDAFVISGNLAPAPLSTAQYETTVDFLPYWYNDFGLTRNLSLAENVAWDGWYDWRWNHHNCQELDDGYEPYDPTRHPLLGWYRGDEAEVLDWQCYWLQEYGVKQSILLTGGWDESAWNDPSNGQYWVYNLLNNTKNAKQMKFATQASTGYSNTAETIRESWWNLFEQFHFNEKYQDMVYCYEQGGKRYALINLWDEQANNYKSGGGDIVKQIYKDAAQAFKDHGYDGICITARMPLFAGEAKAADRAELAEAGVLWFGSDYPSNATNPWGGATYEERTKFTPLGNTYTIYAVATGLHTHNAHPSNWNCPGNTPELFGKWLKNAIDATLADPTRPQMVTCYNIAEWAEGGPGLTPTVGDRFGYLEAIRDNIVAK